MSHGRLAGFIEKHKDAGLGRAYLKSQLVLLCKAYNVQVPSRSNKLAMARKLAEAVKSNSHIPFISPVDDRQYRVAKNFDSHGHIRIFLRMTSPSDMSHE